MGAKPTVSLTSDGGGKEQLTPLGLGWGQAGLANWSPLTLDGGGRSGQLVPSDLRWGQAGLAGWSPQPWMGTEGPADWSPLTSDGGRQDWLAGPL